MAGASIANPEVTATDEDAVQSPSNSAAPTPASTPQAAAPSPAVPPIASSPTVVQPVRRGGLAGIVDEFRDALAGPNPGQVYTDSDGNKYIKHPEVSHGRQWLKIGLNAAAGAAAGEVAGQGRGDGVAAGARGFQAGLSYAEQQHEKQQQQEDRQNEEVKQAQLQKFNAVKLKHDVAANEFALQRMQVKASHDDVSFAQGQIDREKALGSADMGIYKDEADLAKVQEAHPEFWDHVYKNNVVAVPELNDKGERTGIHLFLRTPGIGSQLAEPGTPIKVYTPGKEPDAPPTLVDQVPTVPMTHDMVDSYNNSAQSRYQQWFKDKSEKELKAAQTAHAAAGAEKDRAEIPKVASEINKINAETGEARASAALKGQQAENLKGGGAKNDDGSWNQASIPVRLVEGDMDPSQLSKRSADYNAKLEAASAYSMEKYGKPWSPAQAQSDYKFATDRGTQNTLKLINGMTEPNGAIDLAANAAKALPKLPESTINKVFNVAATEFGSKEATDFHTAMLGLADEYSKVMGGGISSDTGRKQALDILKASYSKGQLNGAVDIMRKDIAARRSALIGDNRYLLKQYGQPDAGPSPTRPSNVPANYEFKDGPQGRGWYKPKPR